jgi:hypothetical protein
LLLLFLVLFFLREDLTTWCSLLALNCLSLPSAGITGGHHHIWFIAWILKCSPKAHVLEAWLPIWHYWEVIEPLRGGA